MTRTIKIKSVNLADVTPWTQGDVSISRADYINAKLKEYRKEIKPGQILTITGSAYSGKLCLYNLGLYCTTRKKQPPVWASIMIDLDGNITVDNNYRTVQDWAEEK